MKKIRIFIISMMIILCLSGCNTNVEDKNTKEDTLYNYLKTNNNSVRKIKCTALKSSNNLMYLDYNYFILENGEIYQIAPKGKIYSNEEECIKMTTDILITDVRNNIMFGNNGKRYTMYTTFEGDKINLEEYMRCNSLDLVDCFLETKGFIKSINMILKDDEQYKNDDNNSIYYSKYMALKNDGNIYEVVVKQSLNMNGYVNEIVEENILYSKETYGSIKDFDYLYSEYDNENGMKNIISDNNFYSIKKIETEECKKYADIECETKLEVNAIYNKYKSEIKYISINYMLSNNNSIIPIEAIEEK